MINLLIIITLIIIILFAIIYFFYTMLSSKKIDILSLADGVITPIKIKFIRTDKFYFYR
jgi:hypothetical protein